MPGNLHRELHRGIVLPLFSRLVLHLSLIRIPSQLLTSVSISLFVRHKYDKFGPQPNSLLQCLLRARQAHRSAIQGKCRTLIPLNLLQRKFRKYRTHPLPKSRSRSRHHNKRTLVNTTALCASLVPTAPLVVSDELDPALLRHLANRPSLQPSLQPLTMLFHQLQTMNVIPATAPLLGTFSRLRPTFLLSNHTISPIQQQNVSNQVSRHGTALTTLLQSQCS